MTWKSRTITERGNHGHSTRRPQEDGFFGCLERQAARSGASGAVLLKDFIEPMGISRYRVAKNVNVAQRRIDLICRGEAVVSADMALRLGRLFGTTPEFWINLQAQYDLEVAERAAGKAIAKAVVPLAA